MWAMCHVASLFLATIMKGDGFACGANPLHGKVVLWAQLRACTPEWPPVLLECTQLFTAVYVIIASHFQ
jgi:hypothetical protein